MVRAMGRNPTILVRSLMSRALLCLGLVTILAACSGRIGAVAKCERRVPPWLTAECKSAMTVHHKES
jgi:hypothetical protein